MKAKQKTITTGLEQEILKIKLSITTKKSKKFVDELEKLCKEFSVKKDYFFSFN